MARLGLFTFAKYNFVGQCVPKCNLGTRSATRLLLFIFLAPASPLPAATIRFFTGELIEGKIDPGPRSPVITPMAGTPAAIDFTNLLELTLRKPSRATTGWPSGVLLLNGTVIAEPNLFKLEEQTTTLPGERLSVPTAAIAWLIFNPLAPAKLEAAPAGQTGGILPNGDFFPGAFAGLTGGRVSLSSALFGLQSFTVRQQIDAVCLRDLKPQLARFVVTTMQGSKFLTDDLRFEAADVTVKDSLLGVVRLKLADISSIHAGSGRFQALAEQKPFKVDTHPGAAAASAMHVQKPEGEAAETSTVLTTAANIAVSYTIPAGFTTFLGSVALPKDADPNVRASFAIYGDGRALFRTPPYRVSDKPAPLRVDLRGAKVITLRVEPVGAGAVVSGDWTAPMILR